MSLLTGLRTRPQVTEANPFAANPPARVAEPSPFFDDPARWTPATFSGMSAEAIGAVVGGLGWAATTGAQWATSALGQIAENLPMDTMAEFWANYGLTPNQINMLTAAVPNALVIAGVGAAMVGIPIAVTRLYQWLTTPAAIEIMPLSARANIVGTLDDLGGSGALGSAQASIIGEKFIDPPEINYEGLPQQTYTTGFPSHIGLRGVGGGAMQHKTDGDLVFNPGMRKRMALTPYNSVATMEKLNKRTTTPNVSAL